MTICTVTPNADHQISKLCKENKCYAITLSVKGGGCAGFSYGFTLDEDQTDDDFEQVYDNVKILVDSMSWQYVQGATIRYKEDLMGASFTIDNPNASTTCGCGSSFAPN